MTLDLKELVVGDVMSVDPILTTVDASIEDAPGAAANVPASPGCRWSTTRATLSAS